MRYTRCFIPLILAGLLSTAALAEEPAGIPSPQTTADRDFKPTTKGKKLLCYRGPVVGDPEIGFDGVITGGAMAFKDPVNEEKLMAWADKMSDTDFGTHTDNFYLCYSYPGAGPDDFDWYDDMGWIVENWRIMARAAKKAGMKGICFDSEYYAGLPLFGYEAMRHHKTRSYEEYREQVAKRGAEIMRAVNEEFPDIKILFLFGYSGSYCGVPQHPVSREKIYTLVSAFVDGLLSECGPDAKVYDMHEQSFSFRRPGSFARARAMMTDIMPEYSFDAHKYEKSHRCGFSFWVDCWENASQGRPFYVDPGTLDKNYYTPEEFAYALHHALAYSDGYVWMWPGVVQWWKGECKTLDADGNEVMKPTPQGYVDALKIAHQESVPEPPHDRRPNTFRNLPAYTQEGWSDEATFEDLWDEYTFLADLPVEWKFHLDWDEVGHKQGWQDPDFNDGDWATLQIREFWENQGFSPYDGAAWYRLDYTPEVKLPADKKVYLAFGGVSDEASVFVDGDLLFASRYGRNMRHQRFLVDVTDQLRTGQDTCIAVRVWNTGWCGGIWKNVKLVAGK